MCGDCKLWSSTHSKHASCALRRGADDWKIKVDRADAGGRATAAFPLGSLLDLFENRVRIMSRRDLAGPDWEYDIEVIGGAEKGSTRTLPHAQLLLEVDVGWNLVRLDDQGAMDQACEHCGALRFKGEVTKGNLCCRRGRVSLRHLSRPPSAIAALLEETNGFTHTDKGNILNYNEAFQLARMQIYADGDVYPKQGRRGSCTQCTASRTCPSCTPLGRRPDVMGWQPTCWLFGKLERKMVPLEPRAHKPSGYAQLYFLEPAESARLRHHYQPNCAQDKMARLLFDINAHNPYVRDLQAIHRAVQPGDRHRIIIHANRGAKERCYRAEALHHQGTEVAVLIPDTAGEDAFRTLRVERADGHMGWISDLHRSADPLCYPLFHTFGEDGYQHFDKPEDRDYYAECMASNALAAQASEQRARDAVATLPTTPREYMAYRSMFRRAPDDSVDNDPGDPYNVLHRGGRLFQKWACDGGSKIIQQRLAFLTSKSFQKNSMRIDTRENLQAQYEAYLQRKAADPAACFHPTGRTHTPNMLPSNLTGSSRDQAAAYRDAMAMVRNEGTPYVVAVCNHLIYYTPGFKGAVGSVGFTVSFVLQCILYSFFSFCTPTLALPSSTPHPHPCANFLINPVLSRQ